MIQPRDDDKAFEPIQDDRTARLRPTVIRNPSRDRGLFGGWGPKL